MRHQQRQVAQLTPVTYLLSVCHPRSFEFTLYIPISILNSAWQNCST